MMSKRKQKTLQEKKNVRRGGNSPRPFNDSLENYEESLDTAL